MNRGVPNSTGLALSTKIATTSPSISHSIWFISFMASTIQSGCPFFTLLPISTKTGESGLGER